MIKKKIEGYYVRDCGTARFSPNPFKDEGFLDDADYWNPQFTTEDESAEMPLHQLDELLMLSQVVDDDRPYKIKITVELEPVEYVTNREEYMRRHNARLIERLARISGLDEKKLLKTVKKMGADV